MKCLYNNIFLAVIFLYLLDSTHFQHFWASNKIFKLFITLMLNFKGSSFKRKKEKSNKSSKIEKKYHVFARDRTGDLPRVRRM